MTFTLVLATTGLSISKHYCGSSLVRTNIGTEAKSCMPGMDMDDGCCDEKTETLVIDDDFQLTKPQVKIVPEYDLLIAYLVYNLNFLPEPLRFQNQLTFDTGPPPGTEPLYKKVQSFLL